MKTPNHIGNLAPTIEGLQAHIASLTAENERLREACEAVLDNRIDLGIAINKCRDALQPKEDAV